MIQFGSTTSSSERLGVRSRREGGADLPRRGQCPDVEECRGCEECERILLYRVRGARDAGQPFYCGLCHKGLRTKMWRDILPATTRRGGATSKVCRREGSRKKAEKAQRLCSHLAPVLAPFVPSCGQSVSSILCCAQSIEKSVMHSVRGLKPTLRFMSLFFNRRSAAEQPLEEACPRRLARGRLGGRGGWPVVALGGFRQVEVGVPQIDVGPTIVGRPDPEIP